MVGVPQCILYYCIVYSVQYNDSHLTEGHKVSNYSGITKQLDTDSSSFLSDILLTYPASSQSTHAISLLSQLRGGTIISSFYIQSGLERGGQCLPCHNEGLPHFLMVRPINLTLSLICKI